MIDSYNRLPPQSPVLLCQPCSAFHTCSGPSDYRGYNIYEITGYYYAVARWQAFMRLSFTRWQHAHGPHAGRLASAHPRLRISMFSWNM